MTTPTTTRSSTVCSSPAGMSFRIGRRRLSSRDVVVQTAVDLISTSSQTLVRLDTTEANCRKAGSPDFTTTRHPGRPGDDSTKAQKLCCLGCPIAAECLADAVMWENGNLRHRVWFVRGGLDPTDRRVLIQRLRDEGVLPYAS